MGLFGIGKKKTTSENNYANIDSFEKARALVAQGRLERMYIVSPSLFGGSEADDNVLYVPLGTSARKDELDAQLVQWAEEGHKIGFNCNPEYKDKSVVPSKITIICKCDGTAAVTSTLELWWTTTYLTVFHAQNFAPASIWSLKILHTSTELASIRYVRTLTISSKLA